ncbi:MAG: M28 family peptidase [Chloroflexota bacterium]|nr:MAG: M28 family peptidase [Chloroflexota bacterium]
MVRQFARSDHLSFWNAGIPAVVLTDTTFFRNPHYHEASDLPDTLDYDRLAAIADALAGVVRRLAGGRPSSAAAADPNRASMGATL